MLTKEIVDYFPDTNEVRIILIEDTKPEKIEELLRLGWQRPYKDCLIKKWSKEAIDEAVKYFPNSLTQQVIDKYQRENVCER